MAFVANHQSVAVKTELDLFTVKPIQTSIEGGYYHEARPVSVLDNTSGPIEFVIAPSDDYIDLSRTQIELKVKITTAAGVDLVDTNTVAPVNNFLGSLFEHVAIELNGKPITPPSNHYGYRSYIEKVLNYSAEAKSTHLASSLFVQDEAGEKMDSVTGKGFKKRKSYIKGGVVEISDFIHSELTCQDKLLPGGVGIRFKFYRSKNEFALMKTATDLTDYKVTIQDAVLLVRKARINPSVVIAHERALIKSNAKFPINRVDLKTVTIPANLQSKSINNIFIGQLPKRVYVGFVKSSAFNSSASLNPYNFEHFNHTHVKISTESNTQIRTIRSDFNKGLYLASYQSLFTSSGTFFSDSGNGITREDYPRGFALLGFDLTEDLSASDNHLSIPRQGSLRLDLTFADALAEAITVILYAEFDNILEIDRDRQVYIDYSS